MKKTTGRIMLIAAALLALMLAGEGGKQQATADAQSAQRTEADTTAEIGEADAQQGEERQVLQKMCGVTAEDLPEINYGHAENVTADALAAALNGAADKTISAEDAAALGYTGKYDFTMQFWCVNAYLERHEDGVFRPKDPCFDLSCGLAEDIVCVELLPYESGGSVLVRDETLYTLVRHSNDYPENVDAAAYAQAKTLIDARMERALEEMRENPMEGTDCELTRFENVLDYSEDGAESLELYQCRYAIAVAHPERDGWAGGRYLDSALRVQDGYHWAGHLGMFYRNGELKAMKWYDVETLGDGIAANDDWLREWAARELDAFRLNG